MKFKRLLSVLLVALMVLSVCSISMVGAAKLKVNTVDVGNDTEISGILGDADKDGIVTVKDVSDIQKNVAMIEEFDELAVILADVDADTIVTIKDASAIQKWLAQIEVDYAIGEVVYPYAPVESSEVQTTTVKITEPTTTKDPYAGPTKETEPLLDTMTLYFTDVNKWGNVNVYFWGSLATCEWPGKAMTLLETNLYEQEVFVYEVPVDATGIVFNNGLEGNSNQTVDITEGFADGVGYYPTARDEADKWLVESYIYGELPTDTEPAEPTTVEPTTITQAPTTTETPVQPTTDTETEPVTSKTEAPVSKPVTIYYTDCAKWTHVNIHYWGDEATEWPGVPMTLVEENTYGYKTYSYTLPAGTTGAVFNAFTEAGGDNSLQTVDVSLEGIKDGSGFYSTGANAEGKLNVGTFEYVPSNPTEPTTQTPESTDATEITTTEAPTTVEPTTVEPTTVEPTTVEPTETEPPVDVKTVTITFYAEAASWIQDYASGVILVDTDTQEQYVMRKDLDTVVWTVDIPETVVNIRFDRETEGVVYNSWDAGNRGALVIYAPTGDGLGSWIDKIPEKTTRTLYFDNSKTQWEYVALYQWSDSSMAQYTVMTQIEGTDIWSIEVSNNLTAGLFKGNADGSWSDSLQTNDFAIPVDTESDEIAFIPTTASPKWALTMTVK